LWVSTTKVPFSLVAAIIEAEAELVEQQIGRPVEQHDVIGEVQVAVPIDPLRQDLAFESLIGRRDRHLRGVRVLVQPKSFYRPRPAGARAGRRLPQYDGFVTFRRA